MGGHRAGTQRGRIPCWISSLSILDFVIGGLAKERDIAGVEGSWLELELKLVPGLELISLTAGGEFGNGWTKAWTIGASSNSNSERLPKASVAGDAGGLLASLMRSTSDGLALRRGRSPGCM